MNDDPREVLSLLNSLGFVGITAEQLKAFMKDLKLYRKIKEHEKQQRKEEIKKKIIHKQQCMIKQVISEQSKFDFIENNECSDSSNPCTEDSLVKVKINCVSDNAETEQQESAEDHAREKIHTKTSKLSYNQHCPEVRLFKQPINEHRSPEHYEKSTLSQRSKVKIKNGKNIEKSEPLEPRRPTSAPNLLEHRADPVGSVPTRSASSIRNSVQSKAKSFIRPWRLQPEVQKCTNVKKSDPVALYQKYQQEWKQMSFPGEAKHTAVRWAVREKMLGIDPNPLPLPRKSTSMPLLRKK